MHMYAYVSASMTMPKFMDIFHEVVAGQGTSGLI